MNDALIIFLIALAVFIGGACIILCRAAAKGSRAEEELWHQELMLKERIDQAAQEKK